MYIHITHYMYRSVFDVLCPKASRGDLSLSCGLSVCALRWGHVWLRRGQVENLVQGANLWSEIGVFHIGELSFQDWFLSKLWILKVHIAWVLVSHFCEATSWLNTFVDCTRMQMTRWLCFSGWEGAGRQQKYTDWYGTEAKQPHTLNERILVFKSNGNGQNMTLCWHSETKTILMESSQHVDMICIFFVCIHTWI